MFFKEERANYSKESIFSQKIAKLTKSESLFNICSKFSPSLTSSELKLREIRLRNFKEKAQKWEMVRQKSRFPEAIRTRSLLKDELEVLKINMSMHDQIAPMRQSQILRDFQSEAKKRKRLKIKKFGKRSEYLLCCCLPPKVEDLLTLIENSESAKKDKVIWKFLKRKPSFRNDFINTRRLLLEIEALELPGFEFRKDSRFQNTQPIKVTCPNCMFFITTQVKKVTSARTKLISLVFAIIGLCVVPHVYYAFKDSVHLCPLCKIYLGFCPAFNIRSKRGIRKLTESEPDLCQKLGENFSVSNTNMVSASSTSAKNLFVESKLRLSDRVQVNVNNIAAITRQIQRGSKANECLMAAAKNFALQEAAIENTETNLKKLKLLTTHINSQLDTLHNNSSKMEVILEQVCSMQR